jgi:hypothetical protein
MKLPEFKAILKSVGPEVKMSADKDGTKQTILLEIPSRQIDDGWGGTKTMKAEFFEADIINKKVDTKLLESLVGKKVVVTTCYLNGYEFQDKQTPPSPPSASVSPLAQASRL